jgi:exodeoxyribonuclease VII small subunit
MADEKYTFEQARIRLEEIAVEVRKKDTSLEKSLDLLEEGVRLANICTELVDHTDMSASVVAPAPDASADADVEEESDTSPLDEAVPNEGEGSADPGVEEAQPAADDTEGFDEADDEIVEPADSDVDD